jgi:hypothetical protein
LIVAYWAQSTVDALWDVWLVSLMALKSGHLSDAVSAASLDPRLDRAWDCALDLSWDLLSGQMSDFALDQRSGQLLGRMLAHQWDGVTDLKSWAQRSSEPMSWVMQSWVQQSSVRRS